MHELWATSFCNFIFLFFLYIIFCTYIIILNKIDISSHKLFNILLRLRYFLICAWPTLSYILEISRKFKQQAFFNHWIFLRRHLRIQILIGQSGVDTKSRLWVEKRRIFISYLEADIIFIWRNKKYIFIIIIFDIKFYETKSNTAIPCYQSLKVNF